MPATAPAPQLDEHGDPLRCLDAHHEGPCSGPVELRDPLSPSGRSFARCDGHWQARLDVDHYLHARYPEHAPSDFDPGFAGESWDED